MYFCDDCGDVSLHAPRVPYTPRELVLCAWCLEEYATDPAALEALRVEVWGVTA